MCVCVCVCVKGGGWGVEEVVKNEIERSNQAGKKLNANRLEREYMGKGENVFAVDFPREKKSCAEIIFHPSLSPPPPPTRTHTHTHN